MGTTSPSPSSPAPQTRLNDDSALGASSCVGAAWAEGALGGSDGDEASLGKAWLQEKYPKAAALEVDALNVLGVGIQQLSVSQLEALEEIHLSQLAQLAEARVGIASQQRRQARLEAAKLADEFREVLLRPAGGEGAGS
uniref:Uncharacterized protein n=1 Tax=Tetraselmis chuii TaxID=63592 RepID=A0A7S1SLM7_9CHLO|mmetsp:Transcript_17918/g.31947  ORF Transcript_17918/g.31947 Transcript_17918/m.31947 type:complete len:139 (+) Transcript_17918:1-417(+)